MSLDEKAAVVEPQPGVADGPVSAAGSTRRRRLRARLGNPLAAKELLARMRGPRAFIVAYRSA